MSVTAVLTCASVAMSFVNEYRPGPHKGSTSLTANETATHDVELSRLPFPAPGRTGKDRKAVPSKTMGPVFEDDAVCVCDGVGVAEAVRDCVIVGDCDCEGVELKLGVCDGVIVSVKLEVWLWERDCVCDWLGVAVWLAETDCDGVADELGVDVDDILDVCDWLGEGV
jgi:hypothetical protein